MVNEILKAIGNAVESVEIDGVLFTLSADGVVRTNDIDTGFLVDRIAYPTQARAKAAYDAETAKASAFAI